MILWLVTVHSEIFLSLIKFGIKGLENVPTGYLLTSTHSQRLPYTTNPERGVIDISFTERHVSIQCKVNPRSHVYLKSSPLGGCVML